HLAVVWRVPAARQAVERAETELDRAGRDDVHHRPPGVGVVDAAVPARVVARVRVRTPRQPRSLVQDAGAHLAPAGRTAGRLERVVDAHAIRILLLSQHARTFFGIPVAAIPTARVRPGKQEPRHDRGAQARPGGVRTAGACAQRAVAVRRGAAAAVAPWLRN